MHYFENANINDNRIIESERTLNAADSSYKVDDKMNHSTSDKVRINRLIKRIFEKLDFCEPDINDKITSLNDYIDKYRNNIIT